LPPKLSGPAADPACRERAASPGRRQPRREPYAVRGRVRRFGTARAPAAWSP